MCGPILARMIPRESKLRSPTPHSGSPPMLLTARAHFYLLLTSEPGARARFGLIGCTPPRVTLRDAEAVGRGSARRATSRVMLCCRSPCSARPQLGHATAPDALRVGQRQWRRRRPTGAAAKSRQKGAASESRRANEDPARGYGKGSTHILIKPLCWSLRAHLRLRRIRSEIRTLPS